MNHYDETILKFSDELGKIDTTKDVYYHGKCFGSYYCVCGQKIKKGYMFRNNKNNKYCVVGKNCLKYVADYLGW